MKKVSKSKSGYPSHQIFKENAKNRVNDLLGIFANLQSAKVEGRVGDMAMFEEQANQMLREWKAELNEPSPASSLVDGSLSFTGELVNRLLQQCEEEDEATSALEKPVLLKDECQFNDLYSSNFMALPEECAVNNQPCQHDFEGFNQFPSSLCNTVNNNADMSNQLDFHHFSLNGDSDHNAVVDTSDLVAQIDFNQLDIHQDFDHFTGIYNSEFSQFNVNHYFAGGNFAGADDTKQVTLPDIIPNVCPPPSAFLGPLCALWDCIRPAEGSKSCQDYCSCDHASRAVTEGLPGECPILRPGGIALKDGPLLAALTAKVQGKDVGVPYCEGAASTRAPWNAPELFDDNLLEGETVRDWLFFDKPRRAFVSGNRKQRSLPDYNGRGWHESRRLLIKEHDGQKRSYYMDPQPSSLREWHLYEYEINKPDACALYRLELKLVDGKKKSPKSRVSKEEKVSKESLADLRNKMGRLTADSSPNKDSSKG